MHLPLRRLSRNASSYYEKQYVLSQFARPKKKLVINHTTDHQEIARNLQNISNIYDLKINFNINLSTWQEKYYAFDKEKMKYTNKAFHVISHFLTEYDLRGFSLNFQLMLRNFDLNQAQRLVSKQSNLQFVKIGCSELQLHSLIVLSQINCIKKLIIHECNISHCHQALNGGIADQLKLNESIVEFSFYKNQICFYGQQILFKNVLPQLSKIEKLKLPTNQFRDDIVADIISYFKNQKQQYIKTLNIGNNMFKKQGLVNLIRHLTTQYIPLRKLGLSFQQFEDREAFKGIVEQIKDNSTIEIYDFEGCNLTIQDVEILNSLVIQNKKSITVKQLKLGLNKFTEEQLTQRFRSDSISNQSNTTESSSILEDERQEMNIDQQNQIQNHNQQEQLSIMDVIERPIDSFYEGLFKRLKMY